MPAGCWMSRFKRVGVPSRQIRMAYPRRDNERSFEREVADTLLPRKATKLQLHTTVPQTDTGARDEYSKALERTLEKELGKLTP